MIVLTNEDKITLDAIREAFEIVSSFKSWSDYQPIEIKNNLWILPESVLEDEDLTEFKNFVFVHLTKPLEIREVPKSELIEYDLEGEII